MAEYDTTIRIGTQADLSGGVQTEKQYDRLIAKAKELGKQSTASGKQVESSLGGVSRAAGLLRKALGGFGAVALITGLVGAIEKVRKSFGEAKSELDKLVEAKSKAEHKEAVEALAKSYDALGEAAKKATDALQHQNEMLDISVKNARDLEDAQLNLAEQKELAAIDDSDLAAGEKRAQISARYAQRRGALAASRGKEDVVYQRQKLQEEADLKRSQAAGIEGALANDDRVIADARRRLADAHTRTYAENDEDATGWFASFGNNLKNLATLNWGRAGFFGLGKADNRTAEGDAKRAAAKAEAEELEAEIKQLEERKAARLKEAENLRKEAERAEEKKNAIGGQLAVSDVKAETASISGRTALAAADTAREKKEAQIARDANTIAAGPGKIAAIRRQIAAAEAQNTSAIDADAKEQEDAAMARLALDRFNAAGHRRNGTGVQAQRSALEEDVDRETAEATQSRVRLQSTLATLATTIKGLNADLKKVEREVDVATRRQNTVNAEVSGS